MDVAVCMWGVQQQIPAMSARADFHDCTVCHRVATLVEEIRCEVQVGMMIEIEKARVV